jgi:hypothetical protein
MYFVFKNDINFSTKIGINSLFRKMMFFFEIVYIDKTIDEKSS